VPSTCLASAVIFIGANTSLLNWVDADTAVVVSFLAGSGGYLLTTRGTR
jgi:hypothetical protein